MNVQISKAFASDFHEITDRSLEEKIALILKQLKVCNTINEIPQLKPIKGNHNTYKIGVGFYTITMYLFEEHKILLMRLLHRDTILKHVNKAK
ncbi:hypothetical protein [Aquimarina rhabdastrellae]